MDASGLLLWPVTLSPDYSFAAFPLVESYDDPRNAASAAAAVGLLLAGILALSRSGSERVGGCMALLFVLLPLLPVCQLFLPVGTVLGERLLYTPSVGYCLLFGWTFSTPEETSEDPPPRYPRRFAFLLRRAFVLLVCCGYAARTFQQASVWHDDGTLFQAAVIACPDSAKIHVSLGAKAMQERNATAAEYHFAKAVEIFPEFDDGLYSLGRIYFEGAVPGKEHLAEALLTRALVANPLNDKAWDFKGQLLARCVCI